MIKYRVTSRALILLLSLVLFSLGAIAGEVQNRVQNRKEVRVCIWSDYQKISFRDPRSGQLSGLDIDLAAALASDINSKLIFVDSSFVTLVQDLNNDRCDIAMFGIGMLPQRKEKIQFATPYLQSDIYAITTRTSRIVREWSDIDKPGVMVGVQAGTFMEPVMRERLRYANLVPIQLPQTREREIIAGRVDVFMTDYPYGSALLENVDWAKMLAPPNNFHVLPYAHAIKQGDAEWLNTINAFVSRAKRDGRLDAAATRHGLISIVLH